MNFTHCMSARWVEAVERALDVREERLLVMVEAILLGVVDDILEIVACSAGCFG